jgi:hypothetical protein
VVEESASYKPPSNVVCLMPEEEAKLLGMNAMKIALQD